MKKTKITTECSNMNEFTNDPDLSKSAIRVNEDLSLIQDDSAYINIHNNNVSQTINCMKELGDEHKLTQEQIKILYPNIKIHPKANIYQGVQIHETAEIKSQATIFSGSIIHAGVVINEKVIINNGVEIHSNVTIGTESVIFQGVQIHENAYINNQVVIGAGSIIHDRAVIYDNAMIGEGSHIYCRAVVCDYVIIDEGSIIHDKSVIGMYTNIGAGSVIGYNTKIGQECKLGAGSIVNKKVVIGKGCIIGAGSIINTNAKIRKGYEGVIIHDMNNFSASVYYDFNLNQPIIRLGEYFQTMLKWDADFEFYSNHSNKFNNSPVLVKSNMIDKITVYNFLKEYAVTQLIP